MQHDRFYVGVDLEQGVLKIGMTTRTVHQRVSKIQKEGLPDFTVYRVVDFKGNTSRFLQSLKLESVMRILLENDDSGLIKGRLLNKLDYFCLIPTTNIEEKLWLLIDNYINQALIICKTYPLSFYLENAETLPKPVAYTRIIKEKIGPYTW